MHAFLQEPTNGSYAPPDDPRFHDPRAGNHSITTPSSSHEGTELVCSLPKLPHSEMEAYGLDPDEPLELCVEVTLNGDPVQSTHDCVTFTYYDE